MFAVVAQDRIEVVGLEMFGEFEYLKGGRLDMKGRFDRVQRRVEHLVDMLEHPLSRRADIAPLMMAESAGPPCDLDHFVGGEGAVFDPVVFGIGREENRLDREIEPHRDRIGGHQYARFPLSEAFGLFAAHFGGEVAVEDADAVFFRELRFEPQHFRSGECDDGAAGLHLLQRDRSGEHFERIFALEFDHFELLSEVGGDLFDRIEGVDAAGHDHSVRRDADDRIDPCPAAVGVFEHLYLVDDGDIDIHREVGHLDRGADVCRIFVDLLLFAGDQRHGNLMRSEPLVILQRQQPQRCQIGAAVGIHQCLHRLVGLSAVGRSDIEAEFAFFLTRERKHRFQVAVQQCMQLFPEAFLCQGLSFVASVWPTLRESGGAIGSLQNSC